MITQFKGDYFFLSNFYPCKVTVDSRTYDSAEAAFQAMKLANNDDREMFIGIDSSTAKHYGRMVQLRPNWNVLRDDFMKQVVHAKFTQNEQLREKLIATYPHKLIEGNTWNDTYWGVCNGIGWNRLGEILMLERTHLAYGQNV